MDVASIDLQWFVRTGGGGAPGLLVAAMNSNGSVTLPVEFSSCVNVCFNYGWRHSHHRYRSHGVPVCGSVAVVVFLSSSFLVAPVFFFNLHCC